MLYEKQDEGEPMDAFMTDLYRLSEHCNYTSLRDELIRDRIVVGILNTALSEKLQLDADLTLEKQFVTVKLPNSISQFFGIILRHKLPNK